MASKPRFVNPLDEGSVSAHSLEVIAGLQQRSGVQYESMLVTSVQRTPEKQASAMLDNIIGTSLAKQKELYGPFGDRVVDVAAVAVAGMPLEQHRSILRIKYKQVVAAMAAKIRELGPENISHHCADGHVRNVLDFARNTIPENLRQAFEDAIVALEAEGKIERHFSPFTNPQDPAFHIEILQPSS
jgi:hypothetical protein